MPVEFWAVVAVAAMAGYTLALRKLERRVMMTGARPHSLSKFHGRFVLFWTIVPMLALLAVSALVLPSILDARALASLPKETLASTSPDFLLAQVKDVANGTAQNFDPAIHDAAVQYRAIEHKAHVGLMAVCGFLMLVGLALSLQCVTVRFAARVQLERYLKGLLFFSASLSILITAAILMSVLFEAIRFFGFVPVHEFLFGTSWSPQMAIRADQAGSSGAFGMIPLFAGTLLITLIAMLVAIPIGLLSAIYLAEYASPKLRLVMKPVLEILAGIPTVVYGYFAIVTLSPFLRDLGAEFGLTVASESALAAGLVMGIMIIPFVSSLSDDIITAVPRALREASLGLGATPSETIRRVVLPAALPGVMGACLLAISRAVGETMIVVMAAGMSANLTANPLASVTTVTVQIVSLLVGDQEFDSPKTLAAFALGLILFVMTLLLNAIALVIVKKYREQYE